LENKNKKNSSKIDQNFEIISKCYHYFSCFLSGLNHVSSICIGLSFSVDAIGGDGVMGMNIFLIMMTIPNVFFYVVQKNYYHIIQLGE
jgi:hypothetical protein